VDVLICNKNLIALQICSSLLSCRSKKPRSRDVYADELKMTDFHLIELKSFFSIVYIIHIFWTESDL